MRKVCFLIPDGVGVRNYIYSGVMPELMNQNVKVVLWSSFETGFLNQICSLWPHKPESIFLEFKPENGISQLLREAIAFARLRYNVRVTGNPTLMDNWVFSTSTRKKKFLRLLSQVIGGLAGSYKSILILESILSKQMRYSSNYRYSYLTLKDMQPDILFCTHQRAALASSAMLAASDLGISTATAIFSWDNLPKARLALRADRYFVWSDYMKAEFQKYYSEIPQNQIIVTGTPQFDFYQDVTLIQNREYFANRYNLDPTKRWVLFSGDDARTSPYDPDYLHDVATALESSKGIQILFRQVPIEGTERYKSVLEANPNIVHIPPLWNSGTNWAHFIPTFDDIVLLTNLAFHCDVVINVGSTMALDFACFDHPGLFINYDQDNAQDWSVKTIYQFEHFKSMQGLDAVVWINSKAEILGKVEKAVQTPGELATDRRQWLHRVIGNQKDCTSGSVIARALTSESFILEIK